MVRESFVFYASFFEALEDLPDESYIKISKAIARYALRGEEPQDLKGYERNIFILIKPQIDANNKRYRNGQKGAEYGKLGGRPKKVKEEKTDTKEEQTETNNTTIAENSKNPKNPIGDIAENPKKTPNDNENVNVNVNVNVNDNEEKEKVLAFTPKVFYKKEPQLAPKPFGENVYKLWTQVPKAPDPGQQRFEMVQAREILNQIQGLSHDEYYQAIKNYMQVKSMPDTWWRANPDVLTWTKKYLDRFLPKNFEPEEYKALETKKDPADAIDWDALMGRARSRA